MAYPQINEPSDETLDKVMEELGLDTNPRSQQIKEQFRNQTNAFSWLRLVEAEYPSVHEDAARMRRVAQHCEAIVREIDELHPMIHGGLMTAYKQRSDKNHSLQNLLSEIDTLRSIASKFGHTKFAKKQRDQILRLSVGGLMLLIEIHTGNRASVRKGSADYGTPPELSSPEAKVIGTLLRHGQQDLRDTTLVNVITAIRKEGDKYKEYYASQLLAGAPARIP